MAPGGRRRLKANRPANDRRRGPGDRRTDGSVPKRQPKAEGSVSFDDKGNAVWHWQIDTPLRREDDPTVDFLECLDLEGLEIEGDDEAEASTGDAFNPYSRD